METRSPEVSRIGHHGPMPVSRRSCAPAIGAGDRAVELAGDHSCRGARRSRQKLSGLGLRVSFGEHAEECDDFVSSSVAARLADLHAAFADPDVDGILSVIGGYNANQLLAGIDYELVAAHPKVLCGFSDITALSSALFARAGLVGYSGPHYPSFGMKHHFGYTEAGFVACVMNDDPFQLAPSPTWSDDEWYRDQEDRRLETGTEWWVLQEGEAAGTIVGGSLCTLNLLQGTPYLFPRRRGGLRRGRQPGQAVGLRPVPGVAAPAAGLRRRDRPGHRPVPAGDRHDA